MSCRVGERDGPSPSVLVESICKVRNGKVRYTADSTRLEHRYFGSLSLHLPYPFALPSDDNFAMCSPSVAKGLLSSIIILFAPISVLFFSPGFSSSYGYGFVTFLLSAPSPLPLFPLLACPLLGSQFDHDSRDRIWKKKLLQRHPTTSGKITRWEQECLSSLMSVHMTWLSVAGHGDWMSRMKPPPSPRFLSSY